MVKVGDKLMHKAHGVMTVDRVAPKMMFGEMVDAVELICWENREMLRLSVRADRLDGPDLRPLTSVDELGEVGDTLARKDSRMSSTFARRFKTAGDAVKEGDIWQVAGVVRDLYRRQCDAHLSMAEQALQRRAQWLLAGEIAAVLDCDEAAARNWILHHLDRDPAEEGAA